MPFATFSSLKGRCSRLGQVVVVAAVARGTARFAGLKPVATSTATSTAMRPILSPAMRDVLLMEVIRLRLIFKGMVFILYV